MPKHKTCNDDYKGKVYSIPSLLERPPNRPLNQLGRHLAAVYIGLMGNPNTDVLAGIRSTKHVLPDLSPIGTRDPGTDALRTI